jgi:hypothetical protein
MTKEHRIFFAEFNQIYGRLFHAVVVFTFGYEFLFKPILGRCGHDRQKFALKFLQFLSSKSFLWFSYSQACVLINVRKYQKQIF